MLVGRERELHALNAACEQMLAGKGSVLFLTGEAGLGKTTLVHGWKDVFRVEGRGMRKKAQESRTEGRGTENGKTHLAHSSSLDPQPSTLFLESACSIPIGNIDVGRLEALQPWADVVAQLHALSDPQEQTDKKLNLKKLIHDAAPAWAWAIPVVGDLAHAALETSRLVKEQRGIVAPNPAASSQQQVFQQYVNLLKQVSEEHPLIIFLDDLHWADASSVNLLFYLSRQITDARILVIGTYRQDEALGASEPHPIIKIKNEILRYESGKEIALGYLNADAIRSILHASYGTNGTYGPDEKFESWLLKISDGNSLFVTQFLKTLREDGLLNDAGVFTGSYDTIAIPETALAVVEERTRRLDPSTRELLTFATAEGEEFTTYVLERLTQKRPLDLLKELQQAMRLGLIEEKPAARVFANRTTDVFGFSHALFHRALYNQLIGAQKRFLHRQCFEMLRAEWDRAGDSKSRTTSLGTKLLTHAEKCEEWQAALDVAYTIARQSARNYAHDEALGMCAKCVALIDLSGDRTLFPEVKFLEGVTLANNGRYEEAFASYEHAQADFEELHNAHRAIDVLNLKAGVRSSQKRFDETLPLAQLALDRATSGVPYERGEAGALNNTAHVHMYHEEYAGALKDLERAQTIYESLGDRSGQGGALVNIGNVLFAMGETARALECYERSIAIFETTDARLWYANALGNSGVAYERLGKHEEALAYLLRCLGIREAIGDRYGLASAFIHLSEVYREIGEWMKGRAALEQARAVASSIGLRFMIGHVHGDLGRLLERESATRTGEARSELLRDALHNFKRAMDLQRETQFRDLLQYEVDLARVSAILNETV